MSIVIYFMTSLQIIKIDIIDIEEIHKRMWKKCSANSKFTQKKIIEVWCDFKWDRVKVKISKKYKVDAHALHNNPRQ
jgi:hypothetical protein